MLPRVKICGITSAKDLKAAIDGGTDAVGFLVGQIHPSTDFIDPVLACELAESLPPFVSSVLVTHATSLEEILTLARAIPAQFVQLHSDMEPEALAVARDQLKPRRIIGKVTVENEASLKRALRIQHCVDAMLLDSANRVTGQVGGTGMVHDWSISSRIRQSTERPIILAGGLSPSNVRRAVAAVRPAAVDVNSGVETGDGKKSADLVSQFVASARLLA